MTRVGYLKSYYEAISTNEKLEDFEKVEIYEAIINYIFYGLTNKFMSDNVRSMFMIMQPNLKPIMEWFAKKDLGKDSDDAEIPFAITD